MRITCDSNILVRAAVGPLGPAREVLELGTVPPHILVQSDFILGEVRCALACDRLRQRFRLADSDIDEFDSHLRAVADTVTLPAAVPKLSSDPDDDCLIATAVIGQADVICTRDTDLEEPLIRAYCATYGIRVLSDLELLDELRRGDRHKG